MLLTSSRKTDYCQQVTKSSGLAGLRRFSPDELVTLVGTGAHRARRPRGYRRGRWPGPWSCPTVGHDSHGVIRLAQYAPWIADGQIRPAAAAVITRQQRAAAIVDGGWGFGQPAAQLATGLAAELARDHGVAAVTIRTATTSGGWVSTSPNWPAPA